MGRGWSCYGRVPCRRLRHHVRVAPPGRDGSAEPVLVDIQVRAPGIANLASRMNAAAGSLSPAAAAGRFRLARPPDSGLARPGPLLQPPVEPVPGCQDRFRVRGHQQPDKGLPGRLPGRKAATPDSAAVPVQTGAQFQGHSRSMDTPKPGRKSIRSHNTNMPGPWRSTGGTVGGAGDPRPRRGATSR
jgi:hypothetical protein